MTRLKAELEGIGDFRHLMSVLPWATQDGVRRAINRGAAKVEGTARKKIMRGQKTGRVYGKHRASAPGEPPASDTGNLQTSIDIDIDTDGMGASVIAVAAYAAMLEFGTSKMAPRPFLHPSLEEQRNGIVRDIAKEINKALARR